MVEISDKELWRTKVKGGEHGRTTGRREGSSQEEQDRGNVGNFVCREAAMVPPAAPGWFRSELYHSPTSGRTSSSPPRTRAGPDLPCPRRDVNARLSTF